MPETLKVNRVDIGSTTLIDISDTTATASDVAQGKEFYLADGNKATGTATSGSMLITDTTDTDGGTIRTITGIQVAGTTSITQNGTYDVSQYASADVSISGGATFPDTLKINVFNDSTDAMSLQIKYVYIDNGVVRTATEDMTIGGTKTIPIPSGKNEIRLSVVSTSTSNQYNLNLSVITGDSTATISMLDSKNGILTYTATSSTDEINVTIGYSTGYFKTLSVTNSTSGTLYVPNYTFDSTTGKVNYAGTVITSTAGTKTVPFPNVKSASYCIINIRTLTTKPSVTITSDYVELLGTLTMGNYYHNICLVPKSGVSTTDLPDIIPITVGEVTT